MLAAAAMIERGGEERFAELWSRSAAQLLIRPRPGRLLDAGHVRADDPLLRLGPRLRRKRPRPSRPAGAARRRRRAARRVRADRARPGNWHSRDGQLAAAHGRAAPDAEPDDPRAVVPRRARDRDRLGRRRAGGRRADARSWSPAGSSPGGPARCGRAPASATAPPGTHSRSSRSFTARATSDGWSGHGPSRCTRRPRSSARAADGAAATRSGQATSVTARAPGALHRRLRARLPDARRLVARRARRR